MATVMITGGHKGLGLSAVEAIARQGGTDILLAGRNLAAVNAAAARLREAHRCNVRTVLMDVSSMASVREAAAETKRMIAAGEIAPLKALMLNAGAQFMGPVEFSVDGYEKTFATNCLGPFLLANLLLDEIGEGGRIVFTASGTHDPATMDGKMVGRASEPDAAALASEGKDRKPISGGRRYATSKLCDILYAYELDRRLRAAGARIAVIAYDPGLIPETGLSRTAPGLVQALIKTAPMKALFKVLGVTMGSLDFSGAGLAKTAVDPAYANGSGKFIQSSSGRLIEACSSAISYDERKAARLWGDSERLVRLSAEERPLRISRPSLVCAA